MMGLQQHNPSYNMLQLANRGPPWGLLPRLHARFWARLRAPRRRARRIGGPLTMVVPVGAGGMMCSDASITACLSVSARAILENAGGVTGSVHVAKAAPAGYRFAIGTGPPPPAF
jgi:hypothetical protein